MTGFHDRGNWGLERGSPLLTAPRSPPCLAEPALSRAGGQEQRPPAGGGHPNAYITNCISDLDWGQARGLGREFGCGEGQRQAQGDRAGPGRPGGRAWGSPAGVAEIAADAALEETLAALAGEHAVVLAAGLVPAHHAVHLQSRTLLVSRLRVAGRPRRRRRVVFGRAWVAPTSLVHAVRVASGAAPATGDHGHSPGNSRAGAPRDESVPSGHAWRPEGNPATPGACSPRARGAPVAPPPEKSFAATSCGRSARQAGTGRAGSRPTFPRVPAADGGALEA